MYIIYIYNIYICIYILMVLSGTFCMLGQKHVPEKFLLKFCILWGQFVSRNSLPCSTEDGRLNYFIKVSSALLSKLLLAFKIILFILAKTENVNRGHIVFLFSEKFMSISKVFFFVFLHVFYPSIVPS